MTTPAPAIGLPPAGGAPAATRGKRPRRRRGVATLRRAVSPLALLALWQAASVSGVLPPDKLAPPLQIFEAMAEEWRKGTLQDATAISLQRVSIGFVVGASAAVVLATMGLSRIGDDAIDAPMQMLRFVPIIGLQSLLILWLGIGETAKISLIVLGVAFPVYVNTYAAIRSWTPASTSWARSSGSVDGPASAGWSSPARCRASSSACAWRPAVAWLLLVFAEQINARTGLGALMVRAQAFFQQRRHRRRPGGLRHPRPALRRPRPVHRAEAPPLAARPMSARTTSRPGASAAPCACATARAFGDRDVLRGLDVTIGRGEFVALLGRSGSGKTHLPASPGRPRPRCRGRDPRPDGPVGGVPGPSAAAVEATVLDNVVLGSRRRPADGEAGRAALDEVGLEPTSETGP